MRSGARSDQEVQRSRDHNSFCYPHDYLSVGSSMGPTLGVMFVRILRRLLRPIRSQLDESRQRKVLRGCRSVGTGVRLNGSLTLIGSDQVIIGDNVHIGDNAFIRATGGLTIGDNTHISRNLVLYTANHDYRGKRLPYDECEVYRPVTIGRNVWIGMNVCISPGSTIRDGAIIGMGAVIHGTVPELAIVGAAPWKVIGSRDEAHYRRTDEAREYGGVGGYPID